VLKQSSISSTLERTNIPSENLCVERYLGKFGYLASISAARSNKNFKAKRIRDDLMFTKEDSDEEVLRSTNEVIKTLKDMEVKWCDDQNKKLREKIIANIRKKANMDKYKDILLQKCKDHNGPIVSTKDLKHLIKQSGDELKKFLRQEVAFKKVMHPLDARERPDLYKMNYLTQEQLIENLTILVDESAEQVDSSYLLFPSEEEIMDIIRNNNGEMEMETETPVFKKQQPLAIVWDGEGDERYWCVALYICEYEGKISVDNLVEQRKSNKCAWVRPTVDDVQNVLPQFIISCDVKGEWDFTKRSTTFVVSNVDEIEDCFNTF
jgi:hypothetical protein